MLNVKGTKFLIEKYSFELFFSMGIVPLMEVDDLSQSAITCSKLTLSRPGVFIVNFEHISYLVSSVFFVNFQHVIAGWEGTN